MDLLFVWGCVALQDEGSVKSKPNVRSAGHPSVMLIHSFSSLSHQRRSHLNSNTHLTLARGRLLISVIVVCLVEKTIGGREAMSVGFAESEGTKVAL